MEREGTKEEVEDARTLHGHHELLVVKTEAVDGKWIRYTVLDSHGDEHCVGVPASGFFTQGDLEDMRGSLEDSAQNEPSAVDA